MNAIRASLVLTILMMLLTGVVYPLAVSGVAKALFPHHAGGGLITRDGVVIGAKLIGQQFTSDKYFHGRPSATVAPEPNGGSQTVPAPYNAANSGASNLGPTNKALIENVRSEADKLHAENKMPVPVDLVTASASGLDPHITPAAAAFQIPRVVQARGLPEGEIISLVERFTESRFLGFFGEAQVNVLRLNLALDELSKAKTGQ